jgi:hypothetical protein
VLTEIKKKTKEKRKEVQRTESDKHTSKERENKE